MRLWTTLSLLGAQTHGSEVFEHIFGLDRLLHHPLCSSAIATQTSSPTPPQPSSLASSQTKPVSSPLLPLSSTTNNHTAEILLPDSWHHRPQILPEPLQQFLVEMASSPGSSMWPEENDNDDDAVDGDVGDSDKLKSRNHHALKKRQQGGVGGGAGAGNGDNGPPQPPPTPTQLSPVTVYQLGPGPPVTYTQTFAPTPVPWDPPRQGSVGLGSISGSVGVVKPATSVAATTKTTLASQAGRKALLAALGVAMAVGGSLLL